MVVMVVLIALICLVMITEETLMGKTDFGRWSKTLMCRESGQVSGFRLRVEDSMGGDDTALNGIQLVCKDGTFTEKIEGWWCFFYIYIFVYILNTIIFLHFFY